MPGDLAGPGARFIRLGLGPLTARQARVQAELLAALARNRFDQIRTARLENDIKNAVNRIATVLQISPTTVPN
ncbi:hypothetical protein [Mesorhizobium sp. ES1-4]|uniref:hypothetical protein n=1 Tax=Mesorhizobium sp. ES1-4 TaxID=2876627 RepID=UPI001CC97E2C|nr:hypothetical protein [Mesorhizobium sp. ES1-4]MBZ9797239.1 hypothetical protein [Mesorhizobium sp. ES1-4]